jgi:hypothetical protein
MLLLQAVELAGFQNLTRMQESGWAAAPADQPRRSECRMADFPSPSLSPSLCLTWKRAGKILTDRMSSALKDVPVEAKTGVRRQVTEPF